MLKTDLEYGFPGFDTHIRPMVEEWFIDGIIPNVDWMVKCREKAYLPEGYIENLLSKIDDKLIHYPRYQKYKKDKEAIRDDIERERNRINNQIKEEAEQLDISIEEFKENKKQIFFEKNRRNMLLDHLIKILLFRCYVNKDVSNISTYNRQTILEFLSIIKNNNSYVTKDFKSKNISTTKDDLGIELNNSIDEALNELLAFKYYNVSEEFLKNVKNAVESVFDTTEISEKVVDSILQLTYSKKQFLDGYIHSKENHKNIKQAISELDEFHHQLLNFYDNLNPK